MVKIKFKFWNKDNSEIDIEREVGFVPEAGDCILYQGKWYKVTTREIDLDTGTYTKVHCKEE